MRRAAVAPAWRSDWWELGGQLPCSLPSGSDWWELVGIQSPFCRNDFNPGTNSYFAESLLMTRLLLNVRCGHEDFLWIVKSNSSEIPLFSAFNFQRSLLNSPGSQKRGQDLREFGEFADKKSAEDFLALENRKIPRAWVESSLSGSFFQPSLSFLLV